MSLVEVDSAANQMEKYYAELVFRIKLSRFTDSVEHCLTTLGGFKLHFEWYFRRSRLTYEHTSCNDFEKLRLTRLLYEAGKSRFYTDWRMSWVFFFFDNFIKQTNFWSNFFHNLKNWRYMTLLCFKYWLVLFWNY